MRPGRAASAVGGHLRQPHRPAEHAADPHRRPGHRPCLDRRPDRNGGPGPGAHEQAGPPTRPQTHSGGTALMWLTWRQFRAQAIVAAAGFAAMAIALAVSGVQLADRFSASGMVGCQPRGSCEQLANNFLGALKGSGYQVVFIIAVGLIYAGARADRAFLGSTPDHTRDR